MKPRFLKLSTFTLLLCIMAAGCEKEESLETDPAKIILGKWEIVEMGNYPNMESVDKPSGYKEYLPDSVLQEYDYETGSYFYKKYWIDTLLNESIFYQGKQVFTLTFSYNFPDNNTLELETYNMPSIFNNEKYKRIK